MKNIKFIILSFLGLLPAIATFFAMLYYNTFYSFIGDKATLACWICPAIAIVYLGILIFLLFNKKENKFAIPVLTVVISLILAFSLVSEASLSKMESDFLDNELAFNSAVKQLKDEHYLINGDSYTINEGTYAVTDEALFSAIPTKQVRLTAIDQTHAAFLFLTLDNSQRTEGYAYVPHGTPLDWDPLYMEWSDPLDLEADWYYICIYK